MEAPSGTVWTKFLRGKIEILQPTCGPKFSIDSIILSGFSHVKDGEEVLDLGTGTGIILAVLGAYFHPARLVGIEMQEKLAECAKATIQKNCPDSGEIILGDINDSSLLKGRTFDLIVSNPPFYEAGEGKFSENESRRMSRHREDFSLSDLFSAAKRFLKPEGRLTFIIPHGNKEKVLRLLPDYGLWPRLSRSVSDSKDKPPKRLLFQIVKERCFFIELPPLILKETDGNYTDDVKRLLGDLPFLETPSFFCDAMLGRLSKYLRFTGFDTAFLRGADDEWLAAECRRSGRVLITRDRLLIARLKKRKLDFIEPPSIYPKEQFKAIISLHPLNEKNAKRCLLCNAEVMAIEKEKVAGQVPEYTFKTQRDFFICPSCGKLTWGGTHLARFRKEILDKD
jgi:tRNA1Val (adenine37-N6)-methyltransferase